MGSGLFCEKMPEFAASESFFGRGGLVYGKNNRYRAAFGG